MQMKIGVLALQGGFDLHARRLLEIGVEPVLIKNEKELDGVDALIIPGGESTTLLKLCDKSFKEKIISLAKGGFPILTTCAGTILIAKSVKNPPQESLGLLDIEVERNSYGRQVDSFITNDIKGSKAFEGREIEMVFIRAPRITKIGKNVEVLISHENEPVLVKNKNILAATFHPELSNGTEIHKYFAAMLNK